MQLETHALDCLYVNWALPLAAAPELPGPLRYEVHEAAGEPCVFASALLFRLSGLRLTQLPWLRVSYPQMNLRLYVLDAAGVPSVLFLRMLVPFWVAPTSILLARQPAHPAYLRFPSPIGSPVGPWHWQVDGLWSRLRLEVRATAEENAVRSDAGPRLGSWEKTVAYFRQRQRGYAVWKNRLRSVQTSYPPVDVWPVSVRVDEESLLAKSFSETTGEHWKRPHSSWLCPEIPFAFELGKPKPIPLASVPAAGIYCRRPR